MANLLGAWNHNPGQLSESFSTSSSMVTFEKLRSVLRFNFFPELQTKLHSPKGITLRSRCRQAAVTGLIAHLLETAFKLFQTYDKMQWLLSAVKQPQIKE